MAFAETDGAGEWQAAELRRRGLGIAIALLLEALLILAILSLSMRSGGPEAANRGLSTFSIEAEPKAKSAEKSETETTDAREQQRNVNPPIPKPLLPPENPVKAPPPSPEFIKVSKSDFDAMDLSKIPASGSSGAGDAAGAGSESKGMMGPGLGPGGAQLYPVAWLREPYDSELRPYFTAIKRVPPGASADIACRMIEHNRVETARLSEKTHAAPA